MSVHLETYLGPYFEFPTKKHPIESTYKSCPTKGCLNHGGKNMQGNFCITCGTKLSGVSKVELQDYDLFDFDAEFPELNIMSVFCNAGETDVIITNWGDNCIYIENETAIDFSNYDFAAIKQKFMASNVHRLDALQGKIGKIDIRFGLIQYYH